VCLRWRKHTIQPAGLLVMSAAEIGNSRCGYSMPHKERLGSIGHDRPRAPSR
jgi:hypothetical protein